MSFKFLNKVHEDSFNVARDTIMSLSCSQGMYSRLRERMEEVSWEPIYEVTKTQCFKEPLDFVLYFEC